MPPAAHSTPPNVGQYVRSQRRSRGLTLEELANRSGVSKSMLSQIERDQTNPTLATVWRLCDSLGVSVESFLGQDERVEAIEVLTAHATPSIRSADGGCELRILGPLNLGGQMEWYDMRAQCDAELVSQPHDAGTVEHLTVLDGALVVESGGERRTLEVGETARYRADRPHAIRNEGDRPARALLVVILGRS